MIITICASISSTPKIKEAADKLTAMGHEVKIPYTSQKIINGELAMEEYLKEKGRNGDAKFRNSGNFDFIKRYYDFIKNSNAILALNLDKNGIKNYVGGSVLMEIGFAHVMDKKIYFYNDIPQMSYTDELKAVKPVIINGDLSKIR